MKSAFPCATVGRWLRRALGKRHVCVSADVVPNAVPVSSSLVSRSGVLGLVTLLSPHSGRADRRPARRRSPTASPDGRRRGAPAARVLATVGNLHLQLPIAAASSPRSGTTAPTTARSRSSRSGGRRTRGSSRGSGIASPARQRLAALVPARGRDPGHEMLDVGARPGRTSTRPSTGSVVAVSDLIIGGQEVGSRDRSAAVGRAVDDRLAS